jgi:6,7-dimethyl-8-ribityllumazine synthase
VSDRLEEREENVRPQPEPEPEQESEPEPEIPQLRTAEAEAELEPEAPPEHGPGRFEVPSGYGVMTGSSDGDGLAVGVVVAKFNGDITSRLLANALEELEAMGVSRQAVTIVPVPGAFELPLAAMALAKTRKYACVVALGCVVRGETSHFDYVAGEAASGLQLAAIETGVPVAFGVLTTDTIEQAEARIDRVGDVVRGAVEMANLFQQLRAAAK